MHIPDGYLSPQTCAVMCAAMVPVWAAAVKKVKKALSTRHVPLMMIGAAFTFVIMMFNVPIPDGTTGHAVGGAILAIVLGPWAASICITIALVIQALLFGDGGIWALGANCFNMAFILPFSAYYVYQLVSGRSELTSPRRWVGGLLAGYIGLNLAALFAAFEFGIQPALFHTASGAPLYCPYSLSQAVPAMAFAHLLVAGPIEAVVTALLVRFLQASNPALLDVGGAGQPMSNISKLWWGIAGLVILSPLGLLAPGTAWGEWGLEEIKEMLGTTPPGMARFTEKWNALFPDYTLRGFDKTFGQSAAGYILSAVVGIAVTVGLTYLFARYAAAKQQEKRPVGKGSVSK